ncbi:MAG: ABC transporter permease [Planctomycetaceae bacterium]|nr:ABC transporter permease [Planctomycetaceae bacterium]
MRYKTEKVDTLIKGRSLWADGWRRLRKRKFAMLCFVIVLAYFALAAAVYLDEFLKSRFAAQGYTGLRMFNWSQTVGPSYQPPMEKYAWTPDNAQAPQAGWALLGTDFLGQSTWRKMVYGAKTSMTVAICASIISLMIGVPLGALAGYFRGKVDDLVVWLYTTLDTIPYILLVMAFAVVLRNKTIFGWEIRGITAVYLAIGLTSWVSICRLIRGEVLKRKESEYVLAARAIGCSNSRIIFRHLLPNMFHIVIINLSLQFMAFIHAEVILSFLGLGESDRPSWGSMIDAARTELARNVWWEMAAATAAIFIISLALNIFGDALRDCLDPKLRTD